MKRLIRNYNAVMLGLAIVFIIGHLACSEKPGESKEFSFQRAGIDIKQYDLRLDLYPTNQLQPEFETISGECTITFKNVGEKPIKHIPVLLYRLFEVKSVKDSDGRILPFTQNVVKIKEFPPVWQVSKADIVLASPIHAGESESICVAYGGCLYGYQEVFRYTKDHIGSDFILIRNDVFAYPVVSENNWKVYIAGSVNDTFDFNLYISVPKEYIVANGGHLIEKREEADRTMFNYKSQLPGWRIDVAAAKFDLIENDDRNLKVFYFANDKEGAERILAGMTKSLELYTQWFGRIKKKSQLTVMEIPEGYGGQAAVSSILLPAEAFSSKRTVRQIYHEVAHLWDVPPKEEMPSRWLSEGFASYCQALVLKEVQGKEEFDQALKGFRDRFRSQCERNERFRTTPISEYGEADLTGASYTKGAIAVYVLHEIVGDDGFKEIFRVFVDKYQEQGAKIKDFVYLAQEISKKDLKRFFDEWVYGVESSGLMLADITLEEIVRRYR